MKKWNMIIDCGRCHDCNDCFLADKDEFVGNDFLPYSVAQPWTGHRWMNIHRRERGQHPIVQLSFLPQPCMHCDNPPCMHVGPEGAVYKRKDGIVIIDPEKAKGCQDLVESCPYGAIWWNQEAQLAQKCTGCAHLIDQGWSETRCSQVCPTGAITFFLADDSEMAKRIDVENLSVYRADLGTRPRVYYKNLYRWEKVFVAAGIAFGDTDECAEGATLTVAYKGKVVAAAAANNYGEVVVDGLEPDATYEITVEAPGYVVYSDSVKLLESRNIGLIMLKKK